MKTSMLNRKLKKYHKTLMLNEKLWKVSNNQLHIIIHWVDCIFCFISYI